MSREEAAAIFLDVLMGLRLPAASEGSYRHLQESRFSRLEHDRIRSLTPQQAARLATTPEFRNGYNRYQEAANILNEQDKEMLTSAVLDNLREFETGVPAKGFFKKIILKMNFDIN